MERVDSLLSESRAGLWLLLALAAANGGFLYFLPQLADDHYAWTIAPDVNAAVIGAGYLAGLVATALGVAMGRWSLVRPLVPGLCVLAAFLLAATVIDGERFRWDYPPTWAWTAVYVSVPVALALVWRRQGGFGGARPTSVQPGLGFEAASVALGITLLAVGLLLFVGADFVLDRWPWEMTPLVGRVVGGWYLLAGTVLLAAAAEAKRSNRAPIAYATVGSWAVFLLLLPLLYDESVGAGAELSWWVALGLVTLAVCAWGLVQRSRDTAGPWS